ncbi:HSF-type DNA-binding protein [Nitzschia inconspicua]|uniref:HSF-type DNA-binding protein n=1 Tax=Nitzschia inconspicua TaxID=303405 RepID=A0A9K3KXV9_9STRA|nr:HSF-type DNA-binding protein [Nitzschia inconspicua]
MSTTTSSSLLPSLSIIMASSSPDETNLPPSNNNSSSSLLLLNRKQSSSSSSSSSSLSSYLPSEDAFPIKLYKLLEEVEESGQKHIIGWNSDGRHFTVFQPKVFAETWMVRYFNQSKYKSFQRQLNLYNFYRESSGKIKGIYSHKLFVRGNMALASQIRRIRTLPQTASPSTTKEEFKLRLPPPPPPMISTPQMPLYTLPSILSQMSSRMSSQNLDDAVDGMTVIKYGRGGTMDVQSFPKPPNHSSNNSDTTTNDGTYHRSLDWGCSIARDSRTVSYESLNLVPCSDTVSLLKDLAKLDDTIDVSHLIGSSPKQNPPLRPLSSPPLIAMAMKPHPPLGAFKLHDSATFFPARLCHPIVDEDEEDDYDYDVDDDNSIGTIDNGHHLHDYYLCPSNTTNNTAATINSSMDLPLDEF